MGTERSQLNPDSERKPIFPEAESAEFFNRIGSHHIRCEVIVVNVIGSFY